MKIVLVKAINFSHQVVPPISLGFIASTARKKGFNNIKILDCMNENMSFEEFREYVKKEKPDVMGFQIFSYDLEAVKKHLKILKKFSPKTIAVCGGVHPTAEPKQTMDYLRDMDYVITGEAEYSFCSFLKELSDGKGTISEKEKEKIPGLCWRTKDGVAVNAFCLPENLDEIGMPAWDLIPPNEYPPAVHGFFFRNFPIAPIMITRGCPYQCTFCGGRVVSGLKMRRRSIDNVIQEITLLHEKYGVKEIQIIDDNFTSDLNFVKEFCNRLIDSGMGLTWTLPNGIRLNNLDGDTLELMKKAGCYETAVGIESGSEKILKDMRKALTLELIEEKVNLINSVGINVIGFFIIGYPTETKEDIEKTIKFAKKLPLKRASFTIFLPLPGTEATDQLIKSGQLKKIDYNKMFYAKIAFTPKNFSTEELKKLHNKALREFYFRPKILLGLILGIRSPLHLKYIFRKSMDWVTLKQN